MKNNSQQPGVLGRYGKLLLYVIVVVLINVVGVSFFTRIDLTANRLYSLSPASREVVSTLSEPLTFKVFFSANLPAPYNGVERYVRDLLQEYALAGNNYFNYQFYNPGGEDQAAAANQEMARGYGIQPVQIRAIEQDEVKFQKAYMGLAMIHGDLVETIPAITATEGLEYQLTTAILRMNNKISRLLNLKDKVRIDCYLSSSLKAVAPYMNLGGLEEVPGELEKLVEELNRKLYGRLEYHYYDPATSAEAADRALAGDIMELKWKEFKNRQGTTIAGNHGFAGLTVSYGDQRRDLRLISAVKVPLFGTQYMLAGLDDLQLMLNGVVEEVIGINEKIGYLSSHGTPPLANPMAMPGQPQAEAASNFNQLLSESYAPQMITLDDPAALAGISTLIIVRPTEKFNDYELYLLDQFLMRGNRLAVFYDPFEEKMPPRNMMMMGQGPTYAPIDSGLEKLLAHYRVEIQPAYVLDEECFKQQMPQQQGGGERPIYFAPMIANRNINKDFAFINNIKGLIMLKAAPIKISSQGESLKVAELFSSSKKSWLMQDNINLNPMFQTPPPEGEQRQYLLAALLEGSFSSYFKGQPMPEKPAPKEEKPDDQAKVEEENLPADAAPLASLVKEGELAASGGRLDEGRPGKLVVVGSADILRNNVVDEAGQTPNAQLIMNLIDYLNGREDLAVLRSKTQRFNPLVEVDPESRSLIKGANLIGLPLLVIMAGLLAWFLRGARRRKLKRIFAENGV